MKMAMMLTLSFLASPFAWGESRESFDIAVPAPPGPVAIEQSRKAKGVPAGTLGHEPHSRRGATTAAHSGTEINNAGIIQNASVSPM